MHTGIQRAGIPDCSTPREEAGDRPVTSEPPASSPERTDTDRRALMPQILARVPAGAGIAQGWREFTGGAGECVTREHFGASASGQTLDQEFAPTRERVAAAARPSIARTTGPEGRPTP